MHLVSSLPPCGKEKREFVQVQVNPAKLSIFEVIGGIGFEGKVCDCGSNPFDWFKENGNLRDHLLEALW